MPQFDKITFFSQIFWLIILFFSFYVLIVHLFVPKLATVLKTRKKKLGGGTNGVSFLNNEQLNVTTEKNMLVQNSVGNAKTGVHFMLSKSSAWLFTTVLFTNTMQLLSPRLDYLNNSALTIAKQHSSVEKS